MARTPLACSSCSWTSAATTSKVTGVPTVLHSVGEDDTGAHVVSHGLAWPVPSDQVINEPEDAEE